MVYRDEMVSEGAVEREAVKSGKGVRSDGRYGSALTADDEERIMRVYNVYNGVPAFAAQGLPYSVDSIRRVWVSNNLKINSKRSLW